MHSVTTWFEVVVLLFVALCCFLGWGIPQYRARESGSAFYLAWFILGILAIVVIVLLFV